MAIFIFVVFITSLTVNASFVLNPIQGNTNLAKLNEIMTSFICLFLL